jgi:CRISPR-associated endoribonuclease Cas6
MVSQHLTFCKESRTYAWSVSLLSDAVSSVLSPVLEQLQEIRIENQSFPVRARSSDRVGLEELLSKGRENCGRRAQLLFQTVTSFKQNGRYVLFPQERLILQSLMMRWNETFPMCSLDDADAFQAMLAGIQIGDYNLRTSRFLLKGVRIPGFVGKCRMDVKLALPLQELWHTLLAFADYAGIGIKTGLGMGGVRVRYLDEKRMDVT